MKKLIALLLALVMVFGLVACGAKDDAPAADAPAADAPAADAPAADAPAADEALSGTITFTHYRSDLEPEVEAIVEAFMDENPGVTVEIEVLADYVNAMSVRLSGEEIPDVYMIHENLTPSSNWPEVCLPLDGSEVAAKDMLKDTWTVDGHQYAISSASAVVGFYYNKPVWAAAGIEKTPTTWAEFEECLDKLSQLDGVIPLTTQYKTGWAMAQWIQYYASARKGSEIQTFWPETDAPFSDPAIVELMNSYRSIVDKGYCDPDLMSSDWDMQAPDFVAGKIGTYMGGSYIVSTMVGLGMDQNDIGAFALPAIGADSDNTVLLVKDYGFCVGKNTENAAAAIALTEYLAVHFPEETNQVSGIEGSESSIAAVNEIMASGAKIMPLMPASNEFVEVNALAAIDAGAFVQEYLIADDPQTVIDTYNSTWANALAELGK